MSLPRPQIRRAPVADTGAGGSAPSTPDARRRRGLLLAIAALALMLAYDGWALISMTHELERLVELAGIETAASGWRPLLPLLIVNLLGIALLLLGLRIWLRGAVELRSSHDRLTGALTRRMFNEVMDKELSRALRYGRRLSLLLIDIDDMKAVNEVYGPTRGDRLLHDVGRHVSRNVRGSDDLFRVDGQRFALIASETTLEQAEELAHKLRRLIGEVELEDGDRVSASIGVSEYYRGEGFDTLLNRTERVMYQAKQLGKDRVEVATSGG